MRSTLRFAKLGSASLLAISLGLIPAPAFAQDQGTVTQQTPPGVPESSEQDDTATAQPPEDQDADATAAESAAPLETGSGENEIVVTGTRIARPEFSFPNPVQAYTSETIQQAGTTNLTDFLIDSPALRGSTNNTDVAGSNLGSAEDINAVFAQWGEGLPFIYNQANLFFVNVPAAKARVDGNGGHKQVNTEIRATHNQSTTEGVRVASYRDICAGKLHAICDRFEPRDFVDLHAILTRPADDRRPVGEEVMRGRFRGLVADLMETDPGLDPLLVGNALQRARGRTLIAGLPYMLFIDLDDPALQGTLEVCLDECANLTSPELR
mgnify:CR=1 FL=1